MDGYLRDNFIEYKYFVFRKLLLYRYCGLCVRLSEMLTRV